MGACDLVLTCLHMTSWMARKGVGVCIVHSPTQGTFARIEYVEPGNRLGGSLIPVPLG
jgi:hypothetical protein